MNVEIPQFVSDTATSFGEGVPYALRVLAGQLAEDPDMGRPSGLPGILTVMIDGDLFEDCPDLAVGYIREPDRIQIRYLSRAQPEESEEPAVSEGEGRERDASADPATDALTVREVADAWHRLTGWLRRNAPDSYAALRPGAGPAAVAALEDDLGLAIPLELRVLWTLTAGDSGVDGAGCLPGNEALLPLDAVAALHRRQLDAQADEDALNAERPEDERTYFWKPAWIPVATRGVIDTTSGWYLDAETGYLGRWSRFNEPPGDELDTLVTYLEEAADMLEAPTLATRDEPGLVDGALAWRRGLAPARQDRWRPLTGR
ncbi:hypothetical protein [Streptomyces lanatus]|uniref:Knr4/Smi1-like domain-containing protein n=1 Tax=Streptomyces lanatus TaxID=66900 RepID=A0ABV1Y350_9ACTN|nr:hypothetical protein [Streptomyces lanatus]GHH26522.1 hypothetical protein GCM10018780_79840 [Streptomyces lanatus]